MPATAVAPETTEILQLLSNPASYAEGTQAVEVMETHISWVFLTDHFVYKLKKPVQFNFLDFSTLGAREVACAEEVRLNRRLSKHVYLDWIPITVDSDGRIELDGDGDPIDYVVKMRRLPDKLALDRLIRQRKLSSSQIDQLVDSLVDFFIRLPPQIVRPDEYFQSLFEHCRANRTDLLEVGGIGNRPAIRRIHATQLRFLWLEKERFLNRVRDGRIVEGHGDLRAEHIFLESPPAMIDCLEFSQELRQVDVVDDLSCLAMDCDRLGNRKIGGELMSVYQERSGDQPPDSLIDFFKSYRACVRAKVAALYLQQPHAARPKKSLRELHQYLEWADHYASRFGKPMLLVVGGLMGSGKSTLACALEESIGVDVLSTDEIRNALFGPSKQAAAYSHGPYRPELRRQVYEELFSRAKERLNYGQSVVLDGSFLTNDLRLAAFRLGKRHGAIPVFIECVCSRNTSRTRIVGRAKSGMSKSEARIELLEQQVTEREDPCVSAFAAECPSRHRISIDTTNSIVESLATLASHLHRIDGIGCQAST